MPLPDFMDKTLPFASQSNRNSLEPDYQEEFNAWKTQPDNATRGKLLNKLSPVIDSAVTSFGSGNKSPTLRSQAKLMAINALDSYDPAKGSLKTHMLSNLRGLQRQAAQNDRIISVPERVAIEQAHLRREAETLADELGRAPSAAEIATRTGLSLKRLAYIQSGKAPTNSSHFVDAEGDVYSPASNEHSALAKEQLWQNLVYHDLGPIDQVIMEHGLGLYGKPILENNRIAKKLNLSPGAISQRRAKIQQMLDERFNSELF